MRFLFTTLYIIAHGLCLAEDLPDNQKKAGTLTVQEAAELVEKANASNGKQSQLDLKWLTSDSHRFVHRQTLSRSLQKYCHFPRI